MSAASLRSSKCYEINSNTQTLTKQLLLEIIRADAGTPSAFLSSSKEISLVYPSSYLAQRLSSIDSISCVSRLQVFTCENQQISSFEPLSVCRSLSSITIINNICKISNSSLINFFSGDSFPNLKQLTIINSGIDFKEEAESYSKLCFSSPSASTSNSLNLPVLEKIVISKLETLDLKLNKIAEYKSIEWLYYCPKLSSIDLSGNPIIASNNNSMDQKDAFIKILSLIPCLKKINGYNVNDADVKSSEMIIKPTLQKIKQHMNVCLNVCGHLQNTVEKQKEIIESISGQIEGKNIEIKANVQRTLEQAHRINALESLLKEKERIIQQLIDEKYAFNNDTTSLSVLEKNDENNAPVKDESNKIITDDINLEKEREEKASDQNIVEIQRLSASLRDATARSLDLEKKNLEIIEQNTKLAKQNADIIEQLHNEKKTIAALECKIKLKDNELKNSKELCEKMNYQLDIIQQQYQTQNQNIIKSILEVTAKDPQHNSTKDSRSSCISDEQQITKNSVIYSPENKNEEQEERTRRKEINTEKQDAVVEKKREKNLTQESIKKRVFLNAVENAYNNEIKELCLENKTLAINYLAIKNKNIKLVSSLKRNLDFLKKIGKEYESIYEKYFTLKCKYRNLKDKFLSGQIEKERIVTQRDFLLPICIKNDAVLPSSMISHSSNNYKRCSTANCQEEEIIDVKSKLKTNEILLENFIAENNDKKEEQQPGKIESKAHYSRNATIDNSNHSNFKSAPRDDDKVIQNKLNNAKFSTNVDLTKMKNINKQLDDSNNVRSSISVRKNSVEFYENNESKPKDSKAIVKENEKNDNIIAQQREKTITKDVYSQTYLNQYPFGSTIENKYKLPFFYEVSPDQSVAHDNIPICNESNDNEKLKNSDTKSENCSIETSFGNELECLAKEAENIIKNMEDRLITRNKFPSNTDNYCDVLSGDSNDSEIDNKITEERAEYWCKFKLKKRFSDTEDNSFGKSNFEKITENIGGYVIM